jgi:putative ABC transport system permease protein
MLWTMARKILLHDRVKFLVAAAGVSVSVLLVLIQVGLYLGFMQNASSLIDNSTADLWVTGAGNENFDFAAPFEERYFYRVSETPGVAKAERLILAFGQFKLDNGGNQGVEVVGLERDSTLLAPWNVVGGDARRISEIDGVVVDRGEFAKLGLVRGLGEQHEISGVKATMVALTRGIRTFTTSPFVFTNFETARAFTKLPPEKLHYALVKAKAGTDVSELRTRLAAIPNIEVYTRAQFAKRTRDYWDKRTGVGAGFFTTAVMGILVGLVVVGQILYNGTLEHLKEYGTMKAMGAENGAIVRVILYQAGISAGIGYVLGGSLALLARAAMLAGTTLVVILSPSLLAATLLVTLAMCAMAATLSVIKVLRLDPATVFKG